MDALISLAIDVAPDIARWLSNDSADLTMSAIKQAIQAVTGTLDPAAATTAVQNDAKLATQLRIELAKIMATRESAARIAELKTITTTIGDSANASAQPPVISGHKAALAWSAPVVSGIVLLTFAVVMTLVLTHGVPVGSETMANMLLGTLSAMATSVVSYWVGSSAGSARKDEQIAQTVRASTTG